jgi:hypothetical protein
MTTVQQAVMQVLQRRWDSTFSTTAMVFDPEDLHIKR